MHFSTHFILFEQCMHLNTFIFAMNVQNNYGTH